MRKFSRGNRRYQEPFSGSGLGDERVTNRSEQVIVGFRMGSHHSGVARGQPRTMNLCLAGGCDHHPPHENVRWFLMTTATKQRSYGFAVSRLLDRDWQGLTRTSDRHDSQAATGESHLPLFATLAKVSCFLLCADAWVALQRDSDAFRACGCFSVLGLWG